MDMSVPELPMLLATFLMLAPPSAVYAFTTASKARNREEWLENPLAAACLNLCPWPPGLGYIYLGKSRKCLQVWVGSTLIGLALRSSDTPQGKPAVGVVVVTLSLILAYDAYRMAQRSGQPTTAEPAKRLQR